MAKTLYLIYPGLPQPQDFVPKVAPPLLSMQDLWRASAGVQPSLLFRVRTDSSHLDRFSEYDRIESCCGMVDSVTRWRGVFRHAGYALNAIHHAQLADVCSKALQIVASQHPSAVSMTLRRQMAENISQVSDGPDVTPFERMVALSLVNVVVSDNDFEASLAVPFVHAFIPFHSERQPEEFRARLATIETMAGAMLLTESASRLAERMPQWLYAAMPEPLAETLTRPAQVGPRSDRDDAESDQEDDKERSEYAADDPNEDKPDGI